ncbi:NfeD family protein [Psychrosphaera ytuae]|uniref:NfeD family protein n=1 Tax=Psychrosphaera ytuae TaxID=2820710 RepID=A0A975HLA1_9GAMM|nr:NfeD family protein [Psychrosphaera ytuae]QTH65144.1 NfeD family protein [Psychrosphaera ytuae]
MWIFDDTAQILMAIGILMAVVDIVILGFATFFLTLIGLAVLTTGLLLNFGIFTDTWANILISIAVLSALYTALLWKPLSRLQQDSKPQTVKSDLIGHQFVLETDVTSVHPGMYLYSGVNWKIEADSDLTAGAKVEVIEVQVGTMKVAPVTE